MKRIIKSQEWQNVQWLVETPLHEETHSSQLCHLANNHMHKLIFFGWFFGIPTSVKHGYYCLYLFFKTQIKQTSNTLLSQRGWTSILTHQMVWVGVWHCQVSPKLQINTSFTSFTSPAWHYICKNRGIKWIQRVQSKNREVDIKRGHWDPINGPHMKVFFLVGWFL